MRIGLFVSRQPRLLDARASWLCALRTLCQRAFSQGDQLVASVGTTPYELVLYAALKAGGARPALVLQRGTEGRLREVAGDQTADLLVEAEVVENSEDRDLRLVESVDLAVGVGIRVGGRLDACLRTRLRSGRPTCCVAAEQVDCSGNRRWEQDGNPTLRLPDLVIPPEEPLILPASDRVETLPSQGLLFHWTRAQPGPWPQQPVHDWLKALWTGEGARRDAPAALSSVFVQQKIFASGKLMRGAAPMVCLTERGPAELEPVQRYRRHLRRWDFEPYGVGIPRELLEALGARPVTYLPDEQIRRLPRSLQPFAQPEHSRDEREWRLPGDLDLSRIAPERLVWCYPERGREEG